MQKNITEKEFWDKRWDAVKVQRPISKHVFHEAFEKFLPKNKTFIEIGCTPGITMSYFNKFFFYRVAGIDYSGINLTTDVLKSNRINKFELFNIDFTKETINKKYDIVASFGFIEHFSDVEDILRKHIFLLDSDGYLVISVPHLKKLQYVFHYIFNRETLRLHNLKIMNPSYLRNIMERNGLKIVFCNYYKTFDFWMDKDIKLKKYILKIFTLIREVLKLLRLDNIPNKYLSPYILVIAKRQTD